MPRRLFNLALADCYWHVVRLEAHRMPNVVERVCFIPRDMRADENVSPMTLFVRSGYLDAPDSLTVESVLAFLRSTPEAVDEWILHGENKRTADGWQFYRKGAGFEIRLAPDGEREWFDSPDVACAEFIVREMKALATYV
jgi:hypothetical protein